MKNNNLDKNIYKDCGRQREQTWTAVEAKRDQNTSWNTSLSKCFMN